MLKSPVHRRIVLCVFLSLATLAAYAKTFKNGFVDLDDVTYVTGNPHIRSGMTWVAAKWAATTYYASNWHPLTWISHATDISLFHLNAVGHHSVSLLFHVVNVILLFVLVLMATRREWVSLFVAVAFALHPINVESVAWVSERKNVLSMMFLLLTLICYTGYAKRPSWRRYAAVVSCFVLGLLGKPQIITLPFLLLLWDYWPLGRWKPLPAAESTDGTHDKPRTWMALIAEKLPLFVIAGVSGLLTMRAQSAGGAVQVADATRQAVAAFPVTVRLQNAILAYAQYLLDAVWPSRLAAMYPHPGRSISLTSVVVAATVLSAITALAVLYRQKCRYLLTGWFWFLGTLVPMIGLVQVGSQARADRYAYLPFVGLFLIAGCGLGEVNAKLPRAKAAIAAAICIALLVLGALTFRQVSYWHNPETLWKRALQATTGNFFAHDSLAAYFLQVGRMEESCQHFAASLRIFPNDMMAQEGLGVCYQARGQSDKAIEQYENVLRLSIDHAVRATAFSNLGSIYRMRGKYAEAKQNYESALQLNPDLPAALVGTGLLAQKGWDFAKAAEQYAHAMSVEPTSVGYLLLAKALEQGGRPAEARDALAAAQRLSVNIRADQNDADSLLAN
jgi:tetratricopeptide (TPR) repeat protein